MTQLLKIYFIVLFERQWTMYNGNETLTCVLSHCQTKTLESINIFRTKKYDLIEIKNFVLNY